MNRGFTLFEMLVSLGIFMLLTTTLLVKNSQFKGNVVIGNTAYQLALAFREAQAYGVNVRGVDPSQSGTPAPFIYNTAYGIHFDSGTPSSYLLFGDSYPPASGSSVVVGDRQYTSTFGSADALVRSYQIGSGTEVVMFCTRRPTGVLCNNSGSGLSKLTWLDVSFLRPQLSAVIRDSSQLDTLSPPSILFATSAVVVVKNTQGICKAVKVTSAGSVGVVENPKIDTGDGYGNAVVAANVCP